MSGAETGRTTCTTCSGWSLLLAGVPLTLLVDLLDPRGPDSADILAAERDAVARPGVVLPAPRPADRAGSASSAGAVGPVSPSRR